MLFVIPEGVIGNPDYKNHGFPIESHGLTDVFANGSDFMIFIIDFS